jgi:hypothetical protein
MIKSTDNSRLSSTPNGISPPCGNGRPGSRPATATPAAAQGKANRSALPFEKTASALSPKNRRPAALCCVAGQNPHGAVRKWLLLGVALRERQKPVAAAAERR